jgi:hypothetical protein
MKKTEITFIIGSALAFSALFYKQLAGVNFPMFMLLLTVGLLLMRPGKEKDRSWWAYAALANVAAWSVFFVNSSLSVFATVASFLVLAGRTCAPRSSLFTAGLFAGLGVARSPYDIVKESTQYLSGETPGSFGKKSLIALIVAICAAIPFLALYRVSNPLFDQFVSAIDFSWFDFGWVMFTLFSLLVVYGLYRARTYPLVTGFESMILQDVRRDESPKKPGDNVALVGLVLFAILNLMLLCINSLDAYYLYVARKLPEGITLSDFVHEAVEGTICSILIAVAFIIFFFKGELNFSARGRTLRMLVFAWTAQTILVIVNTMIRNSWYIGEYQLTDLRIGVFAFLFLAFAGLCFTWYKVSERKSAWWLITRNIHLWYIVLVFASSVNWGRLVTSYNVSKADRGTPLDKEYLLQLGDSNLPQLVELHKAGIFNEGQVEKLSDKVNRIQKKIRFQQWPSYSQRLMQNEDAVSEFRKLTKEQAIP